MQGAEAVAVAVAASVSEPAEPAQFSYGASLPGSDVIGGSSSNYSIGAEQRRRDRRPKRFAVFALMASSNFLGCSFGGSAGRAPPKTMSMNTGRDASELGVLPRRTSARRIQRRRDTQTSRDGASSVSR